jgi:Mn-dependent DtxR family transcriptional regulator
MDEMKIILEILEKENKPLKVGDIERLTGIDRNSIQKIINELKTKGLVDYPDRCYNKVVFKGGQ